MARNNFNSLLRMSLCEMNRVGMAISSVAGYSLSEDAKIILRDIYNLVMNTEYFKPDTKVFLTYRYGSYRSQVNKVDCASNKNTSRSRIMYDLTKLKNILGNDAMDIIIKHNNVDLSRYKEKIHELLIKHSRRSLLDGFDIKIPQCNQKVTVITDEEEERLDTLVQYLSKKGRKMMTQGLTMEMVGYLMYLDSSKESLQDKDLLRYNRYKQWLN